MYNPPSFQEVRPALIEDLIARNPLAALVSIGPAGLVVSHLPLLYSPREGGSGVLRGHLARANPHWKEHALDSEALAIFSGPQHYISPSWYPSKSEHGKVVPTWNYVVIHARGPLAFYDDADWLVENVSALTDQQEGTRKNRWRVTDAPQKFIDAMVKSIIGIEMKVTHIEGKWKVSQNRSVPDREGVIAGLREIGSEQAQEVARLVRAYLPK